MIDYNSYREEFLKQVHSIFGSVNEAKKCPIKTSSILDEKMTIWVMSRYGSLVENRPEENRKLINEKKILFKSVFSEVLG